MIFAWTKQFLVATGFFALVLAGQTTSMVLKEKRLADKHLEGADRVGRVTLTKNYSHN